MSFEGYLDDSSGAKRKADELNARNDRLYYSAEPIADLGAYAIGVYDDGHIIGYYGSKYSRNPKFN